MKSQCRNQIRKALKSGYTAEVRQAASQDLAPFSDFRRLYEETMRRLDAAPSYFLSDSYYVELFDGLGPSILIGEVRNSAGDVVNSTLLIRHAQRLHYHLLGSNPDDARMGTTNLMVWTATQYAITQGLHQFHLGGWRGGISPRDSLFRFKHTFGGRELEYAISGLIINDDLYQAHTRSGLRRAKSRRRLQNSGHSGWVLVRIPL
jgi:lipid II:glycine glycyltransferase (peptidoglycan interpeptide bridge formation enzyme)